MEGNEGYERTKKEATRNRCRSAAKRADAARFCRLV